MKIRHKLEQEALKITKELGNVVFIGALAVLLHTKGSRESMDLDFAVATKLTNEFLESKGYFERQEGGKMIRRTPRGIKIDIFTRPIRDVTIDTIVNTAVDIPANTKGNTVKVCSLEVLILLKHRAARPEQDIPDLRMIAQRKYGNIDWQKLESLTYDKTEFSNIKTTLDFHRKT